MPTSFFNRHNLPRFLKLPLLLLGTCLVVGLAGCGKKSNPTPQLASGKAFVVPSDSVVEVFKAKPRPAWAAKKYTYKPSSTRFWDLIHTQLQVSFDWEKKHVIGKANLRMEPYFYPQTHIVLDAKGLEIKAVVLYEGKKMVSSRFTTEKNKLTIVPEKTFFKGQAIELAIEYIAKPYELPDSGSAAITDHRGLYFINADGKDPDKPQQIWTQGETESASCWFPTFDTPNEKCTAEIQITVDNQFKTLSNGVLLYSKDSGKGFRTDVWEMKQPHSPYLFMMAIGKFAVVADKWRTIPVQYWVEPKYEPVARKIFGNTPKMMEFFSNKLGYPYPWPKYDQVVVRDFVSGAMENTTASVFMEALQCTEKELEDKNWDDIIAHELFHQWFGDLVTLESWANLPLNESFANYSQYLWDEYKTGIDEADFQASKERQLYLFEAARKQEPLIRYQHNKPDDMFDSHSYAKGGRILHMLRKVVGDEAFFEALRQYLVANAYQNTEIHQLRMAFEKVTGQDLNWFFNQWFMAAGHPELAIKQRYQNGVLRLIVTQQQDTTYTPLYRLPVDIEVWVGGQCQVVHTMVQHAVDTFSIPLAAEPQAIVWDREYQLLATTELDLTRPQIIGQFELASKAGHRYDALIKLKNEYPDYKDSRKIFVKALDDSFWAIRQTGLEAIANLDSTFQYGQLEKIKQMALGDSRSFVRASALKILGRLSFAGKKELLQKALEDNALSPSINAFRAYLKEGYPDAADKMKAIEDAGEEAYQNVLAEFYASNPSPASMKWFTKTLQSQSSADQYELVLSFGRWILNSKDTNLVKQSLDVLYNLAIGKRKPDVVVGTYQIMKSFKTWPDIARKRQQMKEMFKNEDFGEVLQYLE